MSVTAIKSEDRPVYAIKSADALSHARICQSLGDAQTDPVLRAALWDAAALLREAHNTDIIARAMELLEAKLERGEYVTSPDIAGKLFTTRLRTKDREVFCAMFLDTRHRMIACEDMFSGTLDATEVHPRVVVKRALEHNAAAIICAHNHPSGSREPSGADKAITAKLKAALSMFDIRLLDHMIVADGPAISMAELGLL